MTYQRHHLNMACHIIILLGLVQIIGADSHHTPLETMADVTNDFGVCVLQIIAAPESNTVFSPYGLMSMALLVYEGATGQTAAELYNSLHLPWHRDIVRIGFRDLHRYLRSYFSSEGFLKGLVLSKANVPLKSSYIEVLRFYGFQPDTSITQPVTVPPAVESKDKDSNEVMTTNIPETTKAPPTTTLPTTTLPTTTLPTTTPRVSTTKAATVKPTLTTKSKPTYRPTFTTRPTTRKPLQPQGNKTNTTTSPATSPKTTESTSPATSPQTTESTSQATSPKTTTSIPQATEATQLMTTVVGTTKRGMTNTEPPVTQQTTVMDSVGEETQKTTDNAEVSTKEEIQTNENEVSDSQEAPVSTEMNAEMNVVTLIGQTVPDVESMNMVLFKFNNSDEIQTVQSPTYQIEYTSTESDSVESESESSAENDITTNEIFPDEEQAGTITYSTIVRAIDTTLPVEDIVILTTPFDDEIMPSKGMSMLEAIILAEDRTTQAQPDTSSAENIVNKRSTESVLLTTNLLTPQHTTQSSDFYTILNNNKFNETTHLIGVNNNQYENHFTNADFSSTTSISVNDVIEAFDTIPFRTKTTTSFTQAMNYPDQYTDSATTDSDDREDGLPTLEPDMILFPTLRLPRAVKSDEKPVPGEDPSSVNGNWVGSASGWHPNPSNQWFWTPSGDKLVPILSYTAYLPYAELPSLSATAVQLPLDDARYSLMILLPKTARGLKPMLHSMQWNSLRNILKSFKPTPVYAVVPTFTIVKHNNLTPALHKLGIRKIFDAYQANLCELSSEPNLYVRSVEQVITISVQKYFTFHKWFEASQSQVEHHFLATHPFAYFVVDVETKVALIAGTIVDPLLRNT